MSEKIKLDKQTKTKAYQINLLHLDMVTEIIKLLNSTPGTVSKKVKTTHGNKSYNISIECIEGINTKLNIYCSDGRSFSITMIYTTGRYTPDGFWDSIKKNVELTICSSNLNNKGIHFTGNIDYDELMELTPDSLINRIEESSKNYKDIIFKENELGLLTSDIIDETPRQELNEEILHERSLKLSLSILRESLNRLK